MKWLKNIGWRHAVGLVAIVFSLGPILFVISSALNPLGTLSSSQLVPSGVSLGNFTKLLRDTNFGQWFLNSVIIAGSASGVAVFVSALAAYVFSRRRFRGLRP